MLHRRFFTVVALGTLMTVVLGCGGAPRPPMGYVSGTVTRGGSPVENITVVMKPDVGRAAMAVTDKQGHYVMQYTLGEKGTKTGPTTVSFEWPLGYSAPFGIPQEFTQMKSEIKIDIKKGQNPPFDFKIDSDGGSAPAAPAKSGNVD